MSGLGRIFQRGKRGIYWVAWFHKGKEYRISTGSTNIAVARKVLKEKLSGRASPEEQLILYDDMEADLLREFRLNGRRTADQLRFKFGHLRPFFIGMRAVDITTQTVRKYISARKAEDAANASINRELAALKRMFKLSIQAGALIHAPHIAMLQEDNARQGFLDPGDFERLVGLLPEHLRDPVRFLYRSGWRKGEMQTLQWRDVDLHAGVIQLRREHSKNRTGRTLPLEGELRDAIDRAGAARRPDCPYVFHRDGHQLRDFGKAWSNATAAAGLAGLLIHDLRRSAVRNMVRAGISERIAMSLTGHKTRSIFDRYNIVNEEDLRAAGNRLATYLAERTQTKIEPIRKRGGK